MKPKNWFSTLQGNFLAGLVLILPAVLSLWVFLFLFGTVANFTDQLLFFLPQKITHRNGGAGPVFWYWSLVALACALGLVALVGRVARNYFGQKLIEFFDSTLLQVPVFNKIYAAIKQVNEAFSSSSKTAFRQVVLVEFPRAGMHSVGFVTAEQRGEVQAKSAVRVVSVFVPTTPNPTSGFIVLVAEKDLIRLQMSVAEAIKFIVSLGAISPDPLHERNAAPPGPASLANAPTA